LPSPELYTKLVNLVYNNLGWKTCQVLKNQSTLDVIRRIGPG